MKKRNRIKNVIWGVTAFVLAVTLFLSDTLVSVTEVQAKTRVFDKITQNYGKDNQTFNIIEVVPNTSQEEYKMIDPRDTNNLVSVLSPYAELGYFISRSRRAYEEGAEGSFLQTSLGTLYGDPNSSLKNDINSQTYKDYVKAIFKLRTYGMIKPSGLDSKGTNSSVHLGEYPLFQHDMATFSDYFQQNQNRAEEVSYAPGVYSIVASGGNYKIKDGYSIDADGTICKETVSYNNIPVYGPKPKDPTVSGDDIGDDPYFEPEDEQIIIGYKPDYDNPIITLEKVTDIDMTYLGLPKSRDDSIGEYISRVEDGTGNVTFVRSEKPTEKTQYYGESDLGSIYYSIDQNKKFYDSNWFGEYVLGDVSTIVKKIANNKFSYETKEASKLTKEDIDKADLIYISGTDYLFKGDGDTIQRSDLSDEVMLYLFNKENVEHKAVMMDYKAYNPDLNTNISKFALLTWQSSQATLATKCAAQLDEKGNLTTLDVLKNNDFVTQLKVNIREGQNGNFVAGNVYVYNHHRTDFNNPKSMIDAEDNFANGDFNSTYKTTVGFEAVMQYITATNKSANSGSMATAITPAVAIQYILISDGNELLPLKTSLNILEIEPFPAYLYNTERGSTDYVDLSGYEKNDNDINNDKSNDARIIRNRRSFVRDYLSDFYNDGLDEKDNSMLRFMNFTSMTVAEFNARNEDLSETYDVIYIGDEMYRNQDSSKCLYNLTSKECNSNVWDSTDLMYKMGSKKISNFTDSDMTGMIYYTIGDTVRCKGRISNTENGMTGFLNDEQVFAPDVSNSTTETIRYPGRDITRDKLNKMEEFLDLNGLIITGKELFGSIGDTYSPIPNPTEAGKTSDKGADHGRVDNSSNLYELLQYGRGYRFDGSATGVTDSEGVAHPVYINTSGGDAFKTYDNLVSSADILNGKMPKSKLEKYVSAGKLVLYLTDSPAEYEYEAEKKGQGEQVIKPGTVKYLNTTNSDGKRCLEYTFSFDDGSYNEEDGTTSFSSLYIPHLYIDINNDGKFSKTNEDVTDIIVKDVSTGTEVQRNQDGQYLISSYNSKGELNQYSVEREIEDDYCGLIKWKLSINSVDQGGLHASEQGNTMVKNLNTEKRVVRILQVTDCTTSERYGQVPGGTSTLNLQNELYKKESGKWGAYLVNVPDYELHIKTITVKEFETDLKYAYNRYKAANTDSTLSESEYAVMDETGYFDTFVIESPMEKTNAERANGTNLSQLSPVQNKKDFENHTYTYDKECTGVDMLVMGFGDNFLSFTDAEACYAVKNFIDSGKPVLTSHDFLHFYSGSTQNFVLRNSFAADKYGITLNLFEENSEITYKSRFNPSFVFANRVTNPPLLKEGLDYTHVNTNLTRTDDLSKIQVLEKLGKEVSYKPGSMRGTVLKEKQGFTYTAIRFAMDGNNGLSWINSKNATLPARSGNEFGLKFNIEKLNDGQITTYPYILPQSFKFNSGSHSQWTEIDLTSDADNDGEADAVVWYALGATGDGGDGKDPYSDTTGGSINPASGYYIYNKGNITYTGAGHASMTGAADAEIQLFVNTLLASYQVGKNKPGIAFYSNINSDPTNSIAVPYDGNVTKKPDTVDSSIVKGTNDEYMYKFVDANNANVDKKDGTFSFIKVSDSNLNRGEKNISVQFFMDVTSYVEKNTVNKVVPTTYKLKNGKTVEIKKYDIDETKTARYLVDVSDDIDVYPVEYNKVTEVTTVDISKPLERDEKTKLVSTVKSSIPYAFYLPMDYLNDQGSFTLYVNAVTHIKSISTEGEEKITHTDPSWSDLTVTKTDLLDLD